MTLQLNIQSSALKNVKLSDPVGSVDKSNVYFHMTWLLPKDWKLLPLSHTFIDHAVKQKNYKYLISQFVSNITNKKQKEIYNETIDHGRVTET